MQATPRIGPPLDHRRRPRDHRRLSLAAALAVFMLILAACGSADPQQSAGDSGSEAAAPSEAEESSEEEITLLVWGAREYYIPPDQFESFEEQYPHITVNWDVQAEDDILQQLQRMKDAGQKMPDVIQDDPHLFEAYVDADLLQPLDEYVAQWEEEDPESFDKLLPSTWDQARVNDQVYGMGPYTTFDQLYYNVPWLEEAGVELPLDSLDGMLEAARALKEVRPDGTPMVVQAKAGEGIGALTTILNAAGAEFDGAIPQLTSDGGLYAIEWFKTMQEEELLPRDAISMGEAEARAAFLSGNGGFIIDGLTTAKDFLEDGTFDYEKEWLVTLVPRSRTGEQQDGKWVSGAKNWGMTTDVEHPYEASLLLRYIGETDNLVESVLNGAVPPRQTEALDDPRMTEAMPFLTDELKQALIDAESVTSAPNAGEVEAILEQLFGEIVNGTDQSPQDLAEEYQEQLEAL